MSEIIESCMSQDIQIQTAPRQHPDDLDDIYLLPDDT